MSLEQKFQAALKEWKIHVHDNSIHSSFEPYLDCDAYRRIVGMGRMALPLIYQQLKIEVEMQELYGQRLNKIKERVFGTSDVGLFDENYVIIKQDLEYRRYESDYGKEMKGNPGIHWSSALKEIAGFSLPVGWQGSGAIVQKIGGFTGIDVHGLQRTMVRWLEEYFR